MANSTTLPKYSCRRWHYCKHTSGNKISNPPQTGFFCAAAAAENSKCQRRHGKQATGANQRIQQRPANAPLAANSRRSSDRRKSGRNGTFPILSLSTVPPIIAPANLLTCDESADEAIGTTFQHPQTPRSHRRCAAKAGNH